MGLSFLSGSWTLPGLALGFPELPEASRGLSALPPSPKDDPGVRDSILGPPVGLAVVAPRLPGKASLSLTTLPPSDGRELGWPRPP